VRSRGTHETHSPERRTNMNTIIAINGSITTPDEIVAKINVGLLSRDDLENSTWSIETPQATLELTYEYHDGEVVDFEIDLIELDEYHD